jgi:hypothetical protein
VAFSRWPGRRNGEGAKDGGVSPETSRNGDLNIKYQIICVYIYLLTIKKKLGDFQQR